MDWNKEMWLFLRNISKKVVSTTFFDRKSRVNHKVLILTETMVISDHTTRKLYYRYKNSVSYVE